MIPWLTIWEEIKTNVALCDGIFTQKRKKGDAYIIGVGSKTKLFLWILVQGGGCNLGRLKQAHLRGATAKTRTRRKQRKEGGVETRKGVKKARSK